MTRPRPEGAEAVGASSWSSPTWYGHYQEDRFLRRSDQVKFARYLPAADYIEEVLGTAGRFLEQTQEPARSSVSTERGTR